MQPTQPPAPLPVRRGARIIRRPHLVALLLMPLLAVACGPILIATGGAGAVGVALWYRGELREDIREPINRVHRAAGAAAEDLGVSVERDELDERRGIVDGALPEGRRVVVKTEKLGDKKTRVRIRVGFWGNKGTSRRILDQMKKHL